MSTSGPPAAAPGAPTPTTAAAASASSAGAAAASGRPPTAGAGKKKTAVKATGAAATQAKVKKPAAPRRKKAAPKPASAAQVQTILNDARAAQKDLALQRAQQAAKRTDPLWYSIEDVLPAIPASNDKFSMASKAFPEQVDVIIERVLAAARLGRGDVTPQAMACLLEHARRYAGELLLDAQDYAHSASRNEITRQDLQLAMELRGDTETISLEIPKLNLIAQEVNRAPLPPIPPQCYNGVLLPPKEHQLTARTFDVVCAATVAQKMTRAMPTLRKKSVTINSADQSAYGAVRGPQILINLKTTTAQTANPAAGGATQTPTPMDVTDISQTHTDARGAPASTSTNQPNISG